MPFVLTAWDDGLMELGGLPLFYKLDWDGLIEQLFFLDESLSLMTLPSSSEDES